MTETTYAWTEGEADFLNRHVTNLHLPVFALTNLPEATKGALFARYSRSPKSLRQLLVDEFRDDLDVCGPTGMPVHSGEGRAAKLYNNVLDGFGDESVAQLGSAHLACEESSNVLTTILERGRLMSYLEQSTRYIDYSAPLRGRWRYRRPDDLPEHLVEAYTGALDTMFENYKAANEIVMGHLEVADAPDPATARKLRAQGLDATRGMLPAAALSNVGIHGSGQAFEALLLRMFASPLDEARSYAAMMLTELRKVIPEFLRRVDMPEYGGVATAYRSERLGRLREVAARIPAGLDPVEPHDRNSVMLLDYDPYAERRVAAAALWPHLRCSEATVRDAGTRMSEDEVTRVFDAIRGERTNRRHKPGRELEVADYRFEVITDYGAHRDLRRHRLLTIEAQSLGTDLGHERSELVDEAGIRGHWDAGLEASASAHEMLLRESPVHAPYPVAMAFRIRYVMQFNAREAMHLIELRSQPQGHPSYRRVVQEMYRQIRDVAGHERIASLLTFVDMSDGSDGRLKNEQRTAHRQGEQLQPPVAG